MEYFATALRWLARQPGVDPQRITVYGGSRGSEAALLLGVHFPELVHAVVAASPSSVVNGGLPDFTQPAWTLHGAALPFVTPEEYKDPRPVLTPAAIIPVERIAGPVLLTCGGDDAVWPSCDYANAIARRRAGRACTVVSNPLAGHAIDFPVPNIPIRGNDTGHGGDQQGDALGRLEAWTHLVGFLAAPAGG